MITSAHKSGQRKQFRYLKSKRCETVEGNFIVFLKPDLTISSFNSSVAKLFSTQQSIEGMVFTDILTHSQMCTMKLMVVKALRGISDQQEILLEYSHKKTYIRFTVTPIFNQSGVFDGIVCVGSEIDSQKLQEERLLMQKAAVKKITEIFCHQVRQPLTNILAITDLFKAGDFEMTGAYLQCLEISSKQLDEVITSAVLTATRIAQ